MAEQFAAVGLCGSAGSLLAFEQFFRAMPADCGMTFMVVTHFSPDQDLELAQVLQRFTKMLVMETTDGLRVRPNHVYVIPLNRDLSILHGVLLFAPAQDPGRRLPIDFFFQSLAKDARERAVCVVYFGLGADGSLGLKMVMKNFGMVMVQAPETAEFDAMPRAALATESVDYMLPAGQFARQAAADQAAGLRALVRRARPLPRARKRRQAGPRPPKNLSAHPNPNRTRLLVLQAQRCVSAHEPAPDSSVFAVRAPAAGNPHRSSDPV